MRTANSSKIMGYLMSSGLVYVVAAIFVLIGLYLLIMPYYWMRQKQVMVEVLAVDSKWDKRRKGFKIKFGYTDHNGKKYFGETYMAQLVHVGTKLTAYYKENTPSRIRIQAGLNHTPLAILFFLVAISYVVIAVYVK